jgi:tRNA threonylcarbamoyladenosine biosynthesis protein TsaB
MPSDRFLAIETSSPRLSLALGDGRRVLAAYTGRHDWRHAESLFKGIETLLKQKRWPIQTLSGVAVSVGPGSFTGIRIGLAAARALGQGLGIPVLGVSSLEILAAGQRRHSGGSRNPGRLGPGFRRGDVKFFCPMIDALRGQVFSALFERRESGTIRRIFSERMVFPDAWIKKVQRRVGRAPLWISPLKGCYPEARVLLEMASPALSSSGPQSYKSVLPLYIRQAAAVERRRP